jgi:hypothetical protein
LVRDRETNVCELAGSQYNFCNLGFHRIWVAESDGEQAFEEIVLLKVVIALVVNSEEVPHILHRLGIKNVVQGHAVECCHNLQLGLLVMSGSFKVSLSICGHWGRSWSIDNVPQAFILEHEGSYLAPLCVVVAIVIKRA